MVATRVCVFDEQLLVRDALHRLLATQGLEVVSSYGDGQAMLSALPSSQVELVVMDPPADATEAAYLITETCHASEGVRVLVLSTGRSTETVENFFRVGASGYLDKQHTHLPTLMEAIEAVHAGRNVYPVSAVESLLRAAPAAVRSGPVQGLSSREKQVLGLVSVGADNLQIAARLSISERTVKAHVSSLYRKLGMENRTQLALLARESGIRPPVLEATANQER